MVGDDLKFDEAKEAIPPKQNGMVFAVNQFLSGLDAVPKSARLLSAEVKGGIAELNFNEALVAGYGTEDEMIIVEGILRTMAQFEGVDAVQFQVNKAALDTLGGIDLSTPQKVIR
jgi:spore germination protein GerM